MPTAQPAMRNLRNAGTKHCAPVVFLCALAGVLVLPAHREDRESLIDKALSQSRLVTQVKSLLTAILMAVPGEVFPDGKAKDAVVTAFKKSAVKAQTIETPSDLNLFIVARILCRCS